MFINASSSTIAIGKFSLKPLWSTERAYIARLRYGVQLVNRKSQLGNNAQAAFHYIFIIVIIYTFYSAWMTPLCSQKSKTKQNKTKNKQYLSGLPPLNNKKKKKISSSKIKCRCLLQCRSVFKYKWMLFYNENGPALTHTISLIILLQVSLLLWSLQKKWLNYDLINLY